jgi:hypothetical protein
MSRPPEDRDAKIARLERELAEALARVAAAEAVIADQRARLQTLGMGREESMRALAATKSELHRVSRERDELKLALDAGDEAHTATITLPEDYTDTRVDHGATLPSIEDLMAALDGMKESLTAKASAGHLHMRVQASEHDEESQEMLAPELVFPERYAATAKSKGGGEGRITRLLVLLDAEKPIKYPLYKDEMTIGRADFADIQIESHFISRLHARLVTTPEGVVVEDIDSKNGVKINAKPTTRQALRHGDLIALGALRFRYLDASAEEA